VQNFITVAIDGAAASGKTSTSLWIANEYNLLLVSTGMHYRAITLKIMQAGVSSADGRGIDNFLRAITLGTEIGGNIAGITINGESFGEKNLRTQEVNDTVTRYSAVDSIRKFLLPYQKFQVHVAREHNFRGVIMEGRDITSVILPHADLKFFLEASARKRSLRRKNDGEPDFISERDKLDGQRTICTAGVFRIDTGKNNFRTVTAVISNEIEKILSK
jgi:cytidylate kinase